MANQSQRMTVEQYIQITDWLKAFRDKIRIMDCTQLEVAALATRGLNFEVPLSSIQRCGKIAKICWPKSPPKPPPVPIERDAIIILIAAIAGLYIETGKTVPENLANLKTAYVQESNNERNPNEVVIREEFDV